MCNDNILNVKDLDIVFKVSNYPVGSLRDTFVQIWSDPISLLVKRDDFLYLIKKASFSINKGDRVGLIGKNGTGKTSICRTIAGFYGHNKKNIRINGEVRAIFNTEVGVLPELSGRENCQLLARFIYPGLTHSKYSEIVEEAITFSEISNFADSPFKYYSRGMKARLFLSLISSRPSDLLILDEIFDGADHFFNNKIADRVKKMIDLSGAVIFVSHSVDLVEKICNRVILIRDNRIYYDGSVKDGIKEFLNQPAGFGY